MPTRTTTDTRLFSAPPSAMSVRWSLLRSSVDRIPPRTVSPRSRTSPALNCQQTRSSDHRLCRMARVAADSRKDLDRSWPSLTAADPMSRMRPILLPSKYLDASSWKMSAVGGRDRLASEVVSLPRDDRRPLTATAGLQTYRRALTAARFQPTFADLSTTASWHLAAESEVSDRMMSNAYWLQLTATDTSRRASGGFWNRRRCTPSRPSCHRPTAVDKCPRWAAAATEAAVQPGCRRVGFRSKRSGSAWLIVGGLDRPAGTVSEVAVLRPRLAT